MHSTQCPIVLLTVIIPYCANFRLILSRLAKKWPTVQSSITSIRLWIYCNEISQTAFDVLANLLATNRMYNFSPHPFVLLQYLRMHQQLTFVKLCSLPVTNVRGTKKNRFSGSETSEMAHNRCSNNCLSHLRMRAASVIMLYGVHGLHPLLSVAKDNLYSFSQLMASLSAYVRSYKMPLSTVWLKKQDNWFSKFVHCQIFKVNIYTSINCAWTVLL